MLMINHSGQNNNLVQFRDDYLDLIKDLFPRSQFKHIENDALCQPLKYYQLIKAWRIYFLRMSKVTGILERVRDIFLPLLEIISVPSCNIASIEGLSRLSAPNLTELILQKNQLTTIKQFRRVNFPLLQRIALVGNHILNPQAIVFLQNEINLIYLGNETTYESTQEYGLSWVAKIESPRLAQLMIVILNPMHTKIEQSNSLRSRLSSKYRPLMCYF